MCCRFLLALCAIFSRILSSTIGVWHASALAADVERARAQSVYMIARLFRETMAPLLLRCLYSSRRPAVPDFSMLIRSCRRSLQGLHSEKTGPRAPGTEPRRGRFGPAYACASTRSSTGRWKGMHCLRCPTAYCMDYHGLRRAQIRNPVKPQGPLAGMPRSIWNLWHVLKGAIMPMPSQNQLALHSTDEGFKQLGSTVT